METVEFKELLQKEFGNKFLFHPEFHKEFIALISKSGAEQKIIKQFLNRLHAILILDNIDCGLPWLESLKQCDNMYSLHLKEGKKNFRVLYSKTKNGKFF